MRLRALQLMVALAAAGAAWAGDVGRIEPEALAAQLETAEPPPLILDVRTAVEFDESHIPGAVNIPHDALDGRIPELGATDGRDIVVYCRSGRRSAIALAALQRAGFSRLFHLEGDWLRWSEEGRPLIRATAKH
ncbi:MAG: rhodanese-like domain-containing protein [Steroidobacteraceae bacterium]